MKENPISERFAGIDDPFEEYAAAPLRSLDPPRIPPTKGGSPTRSGVRTIRRTAFVSALLYEVVFMLVVEHPSKIAKVSTAELVVGLAIPLAAALGVLAAAARKGSRGLGLSAGWLAALVAAGPVFFVMATMLAAPVVSADPLFWRHVSGCVAVTASLALGPLGLGLWAYRRAFVAAARWRAAGVGIAGGALAAASMRLACPLDSAWHVILGHGSVMLVAGLAGAWLAPSVTRS